jgi:hypothetical protein
MDVVNRIAVGGTVTCTVVIGSGTSFLVTLAFLWAVNRLIRRDFPLTHIPQARTLALVMALFFTVEALCGFISYNGRRPSGRLSRISYPVLPAALFPPVYHVARKPAEYIGNCRHHRRVRSPSLCSLPDSYSPHPCRRWRREFSAVRCSRHGRVYYPLARLHARRRDAALALGYRYMRVGSVYPPFRHTFSLARFIHRAGRAHILRGPRGT